jgi:hypothetical protein
MTASNLHIEVAETTDSVKWQENLSRSSSATVFQSYQWARAYLEALHDIPLFLTVRDKSENVVAQLLLFVVNEFERRLSPRYNRYLRFVPSRLGVGTRLVWSYGPIIHDESLVAEILESILEEADKLAHEWGATQIYGISPPLETHSDEYRDTYRRSSYTVQDWGTFVTDVTRDEQTIWSALDKKTRNDIRRAESRIVIREVTDRGLLAKFALLSAKFNEVKRGRPEASEAMKYYDVFWKWLHRSDQSVSPASNVFLAFEDEQPRAGLMLNSFNGNVTQHSVISDGAKGNLGGPLLTWQAIRWAHSCGCKTLDLVGVNPSPSNPEEKGIYFYKSKWGGTFRRQYNLLRIVKPLGVKLFAGYVKVQKRLWSIQGLVPH